MPDNLRILVRAGSGVQIFNLQTMQEDGFLEAPTNLNGPVVALSPDGETLAWGLEDNTIQLIRISDQELLHTLTGHTGPITKLRFSPEGDTLFSASQDSWVMVWDRNEKQVKAFQPGGAEVVGLGISPDERYLAYSDINANNAVFLTSPDRAQKMGTLEGHPMPVFELIFSPDGGLLASADDTGIRIWQVEDGKLLFVGKSACP
jgi:WD40 repeat protein